jgi:hypothetical protein
MLNTRPIKDYKKTSNKPNNQIPNNLVNITFQGAISSGGDIEDKKNIIDERNIDFSRKMNPSRPISNILDVTTENKEYQFFKSNVYLGKFTIGQLILYITNLDIILQDKTSSDYKEAIELINTHILQKDQDGNINILGAENSVFTKNLDLMIQFNDDIIDFEKNEFTNDLDNISPAIVKEIKDNYLQLKNKLTNHILEMIGKKDLSQIDVYGLPDNERTNVLKENNKKLYLANYGSSILYRMIKNTNSHISEIKKENIRLESLIDTHIKLQNLMQEKVEQFQKTTTNQEKEVEYLENVEEIKDVDDSLEDIIKSQDSPRDIEKMKQSNQLLMENINKSLSQKQNVQEQNVQEQNVQGQNVQGQNVQQQAMQQQAMQQQAMQNRNQSLIDTDQKNTGDGNILNQSFEI